MTNRLLLPFLVTALAMAGCATDPATPGTGDPDGPSGSLRQAGSSTVFPIAEAWAEELSTQGIQVTVGGGGSGAGASKLCAKEIDIGDLSRKMKDAEVQDCRANGVEPAEWTVAFDGLTIVVSAQNDFIDHLSVDELQRLWTTGSDVQTWADLRDGWPARPVQLYGPDSDSGTYEYFAEEVLGKDCGADGKSLCAPRSDYTPSADDNVLVEGVASSQYALGHFGFAYFEHNADRLKAVPIRPANTTGAAVSPSFETIADGTYKPLSRPLFMYTNGVPAEGTVLYAYLEYGFGAGQDVLEEVGYVALDAAKLQKMKDQLN